MAIATKHGVNEFLESERAKVRGFGGRIRSINTNSKEPQQRGLHYPSVW